MEYCHFPKRLTVLLEPTAACNLRCKHCYHAKTSYVHNKMSMDVLDKFLFACMPHYKAIRIIWHGGEPLLMGLDFFESAYNLINQYANKFDVKVEFGLQTNGTLLNEKNIDFFKNTNTHISLSYDGPFNDILRQRTSDVEQAIYLLKKKEVKFSCLSTINSASVEQLIETYNFFKDLNVPIKFNPIFPDGAAKENSLFIMSSSQWAEEFCKLFINWFYDKDCNIEVSSCCDILKKYLGLFKNGCVNGTCMFRFVAIDANGNLYPCGRLVDQNYLLADVSSIDDIRQIFISPNYLKILERNEQRIAKCKDCKWFSQCHAGCNASASLAGDVSKPFDFECYFTKYMFNNIENLLNNYDDRLINKYARKILKSSCE